MPGLPTIAAAAGWPSPSAFQPRHIPSCRDRTSDYTLLPVARWSLLLLSPLLSAAHDGWHLGVLVLVTICGPSSAHRAGVPGVTDPPTAGSGEDIRIPPACWVAGQPSLGCHPGPGGMRAFSSAASRARNGPIRSPSWAGCRNRLSLLTVYRVRRPVRRAGQVAGGLQVGHDGLDGALGQSRGRAYVPDPGVGVAADLHEHVPVPGQQRPAAAALVTVTHSSRLYNSRENPRVI